MREPVPELGPEPSKLTLSNPIVRYFSATRPAFLTATLLASSLGLVCAISSGVHLQPVMAMLTVLLALTLHAGVNVLNDYFDALNGTDAVNIERIYPFTGGSRFIQNGMLTPAETARFGYALLGLVMLGGILLAWQAGTGLLLLGAMGMLIGWAYSAEPLRLNGRAWGELCVLSGFLGVVIGADYVQRHAFSSLPVLVGLPYALLVANLLYINQFPDRKADALSGKRTLVVRLSLTSAPWVYLGLAVMAYGWLLSMVRIGVLPVLALVSALPLFLSLRAFLLLREFAARPAQLLPAIKLTLAAMLGHALLLIAIMLWKMP